MRNSLTCGFQRDLWLWPLLFTPDPGGRVARPVPRGWMACCESLHDQSYRVSTSRRVWNNEDTKLLHDDLSPGLIKMKTYCSSLIDRSHHQSPCMYNAGPYFLDYNIMVLEMFTGLHRMVNRISFFSFIFLGSELDSTIS